MMISDRITVKSIHFKIDGYVSKSNGIAKTVSQDTKIAKVTTSEKPHNVKTLPNNYQFHLKLDS